MTKVQEQVAGKVMGSVQQWVKNVETQLKNNSWMENQPQILTVWSQFLLDRLSPGQRDGQDGGSNKKVLLAGLEQ